MDQFLGDGAHPQDTVRLQIDEEMRAVDQALRMTAYRERFELRSHGAVHYTDLQELLLRYRPQIVHFSGHSSQTGGLILQSDSGAHPVTTEALSTLFVILKDNLRCVVLNACYSETQAQAIAQNIDYVIGTSGTIGDKAAINFSAAFYQALGYGRSLQEAFKLGCNLIDLANLADKDKPHLLALHGGPANLILVAPAISDIGSVDSVRTSKKLWSIISSRMAIILILFILIGWVTFSVLRMYSTQATWPKIQMVGPIMLQIPAQGLLAEQSIGHDCSLRLPIPGERKSVGTILHQGTPVTITFTIRNSDTRSAEIPNLVAAVRGPYAWELGWNAPLQDFPRISNLVIAPGQRYVYQQSQTFYQPGEYFVEPTLQNNLGQWGGIKSWSIICFVVAN